MEDEKVARLQVMLQKALEPITNRLETIEQKQEELKVLLQERKERK